MRQPAGTGMAALGETLSLLAEETAIAGTDELSAGMPPRTAEILNLFVSKADPLVVS